MLKDETMTDEQHAHEGHRPVRADGDRRRHERPSTGRRAVRDQCREARASLQDSRRSVLGIGCRGLTLAKGTKLDVTIIYTSSVVDPEQIMKVKNSAPAKLFKDSWVQIRDASEFWK